MTSTTLSAIRQRANIARDDRGEVDVGEALMLSFAIVVAVSLLFAAFSLRAQDRRYIEDQLDAVNQEYHLELQSLPRPGHSFEIAHEGKKLTVSNGGGDISVFEGDKEYVPED